MAANPTKSISGIIAYLQGALSVAGATFGAALNMGNNQINALANGALVNDAAVIGQLPAEWSPRDQGADAWTQNPGLGGTATFALSAAGTIQLHAINRRWTRTPTGSLYVRVSNAGSGLSNCWIGLYNAAGTLIAISADQSTNWQTATNYTVTLTAVTGQSLMNLPAGIYYLGFYVGGATTLPSFYAGNSGSTAYLNAGASTASLGGGSRACSSSLGTGIAPASAPNISGAVTAVGQVITAVLV